MEQLLGSRRWEIARAGATLLVLAFAIPGCGRATRDDATEDAASPADSRRITLTLWPFYELPEDENGPREPVSIGGVEVCVAFERRWGEDWTDFVETKGPCEHTVEAEPVLLRDVRGPAELIITATREGYRSILIAVTTWQWDMDVTEGTVDGRLLSLRRAGSKTARVDPTVAVDPRLGDLSFFPGTCATPPDDGGSSCGSVGGVRVSLEPAVGDGPYYSGDGRFVPGATQTVAGEYEPVSRRPAVSFVNLPGREYFVHATHPHAFCRAAGRGGVDGNPLWGFSRPAGVIGAPVLEGFSTPAIVANCDCVAAPGFPGLTSDWRDCVPVPLADAGGD